MSQDEKRWALAMEAAKWASNPDIPDVKAVLFWGKMPGTGKSYLANTGGLFPGQRSFFDTLTVDKPSVEIRGHHILDGDKMRWMDGPGTRAAKHQWKHPDGRTITGTRFAVHEMGKASLDTECLFLALGDNPESCQYDLPNLVVGPDGVEDCEQIKPGEGFNIIATMNEDPSKRLIEPLLDRFTIRIELNTVNPFALRRFDKAIATIVKKSVESGKTGLRSWITFNALIKNGVDIELAARSVFGEDRMAAVIDAVKVASAA